MVDIAVAHPGKIGDMLYALMVSRHIALKYNSKVDFYTSAYCEPARSLVEYQQFISDMVVPDDYVIKDMGCGIQPWQMPVPNKYRHIFQLGFKTTPNKFLGDWMAEDAGVQFLYIALDTPKTGEYFIGDEMNPPYFTMCLRGSTDYEQLGRDFVELSPYPVMEIGGMGDRVSDKSVNRNGADFLETATLIERSAGFVGLMSAMLVVANAFPKIPKVAVHDGVHWDMRHVYRSSKNFYPVKPTAQEVLDVLLNSNA